MFVYTVILHVPLWLQVYGIVSGQNYPTKHRRQLDIISGGSQSSILQMDIKYYFWEIYIPRI